MSPATLSPSWVRQLKGRFTTLWTIKAIAIPAFMCAFFAAYFHLLEHPRVPATEMPLLFLDRIVGFQPLAILPYVSLWFYVSIPPSFVSGRREITFYCAAVAVLTLGGLGTFYLWPSVLPATDIDWSRYPSFAFLKNVDASGNACPSLHVAFSMFTTLWLERLFRQIGAPVWIRLASVAWSAAIIYSTIATKQHVTVDLVAGIGLGAAMGFFDPRCDTAMDRVHAQSPWNRQLLAFVVSLAAKFTVVSLDLWPAHPVMAAALFCGPDIWILAGLLIPNVSTLIPTVTRFVTSRREVWLTIDDGPEPSTTPAMLDLLDQHAARATFFLLGEKIAAHPGLVQEILRRGHNLGNHSQTHPLATFWMAGPWRTAAEVDGCRAALQQCGPAARTEFFRAPAGIKTFFLRRTLATRSLLLVGWSARGRETTSQTIETPLRRLLRRLAPGAILLVHESSVRSQDRIALLTELLRRLSADGYRCVIPAREDLR